MMRRSVQSGRFLPTATADRLPLFVRPVKRASNVKAEQTKRERQRAKVWAKADDLRAGR